ncbi:hypothetical protein SS50377_23963 [Spironucleus salmonicida]|uniref:Uncharacterized protein n=1 Tax=Spironucleus salmonicida TaxID=348837 RepID=V6LGU6_9EUKA|nr:hypothetical protein SS50377_23963 [Spironucleus salmonicida]|eukprot:EST42931.1 Hypothetical protein SS50377_17463 [Spironucleus salmonicida]
MAEINFSATAREIDFKKIQIQSQITTLELIKLKFYHTDKFNTKIKTLSKSRVSEPLVYKEDSFAMNSSISLADNSSSEQMDMPWLLEENARLKLINLEETRREIQQKNMKIQEIQQKIIDSGIPLKRQILESLIEKQRLVQVLKK